MYLLGIDGGGTRTRAALVRRDGSVLAIGTAGGSNYQSVGIERARMAIDEAVADAFEQSGTSRSTCDAAFLGMAGVVTATDRSTIIDIVAGLGLAQRISVDHDIRIALAGGLSGREGIAVIAGTGSSCYGRRADGREHRAGGWGALLDDAGGGYWLGVEALRAAVRAHDGRGEPTALLSSLTQALHLGEMDDLLRLTGISGLTKEEIASLSPLVLRHAFDGDDVAGAIVQEGANELSAMVLAVKERLWSDSSWPPVIGVGGLLDNRRYRRMIEPELLEPQLPSVLGAALLAMEESGITIEEPIIHSMTTYVTRTPDE